MSCYTQLKFSCTKGSCVDSPGNTTFEVTSADITLRLSTLEYIGNMLRGRVAHNKRWVWTAQRVRWCMAPTWHRQVHASSVVIVVRLDGMHDSYVLQSTSPHAGVNTPAQSLILVSEATDSIIAKPQAPIPTRWGLDRRYVHTRSSAFMVEFHAWCACPLTCATVVLLWCVLVWCADVGLGGAFQNGCLERCSPAHVCPSC